jgi:hypothetical protein
MPELAIDTQMQTQLRLVLHSLLRSSSRSAEGWYDLHRNGLPVKSQTGVAALYLRFAVAVPNQSQEPSQSAQAKETQRPRAGVNDSTISGRSTITKSNPMSAAPPADIMHGTGFFDISNIPGIGHHHNNIVRASRIPPPPADKLRSIDGSHGAHAESTKLTGPYKSERHPLPSYTCEMPFKSSEDSVCSVESTKAARRASKEERKKNASAETQELKKCVPVYYFPRLSVFV